MALPKGAECSGGRPWGWGQGHAGAGCGAFGRWPGVLGQEGGGVLVLESSICTRKSISSEQNDFPFARPSVQPSALGRGAPAALAAQRGRVLAAGCGAAPPAGA